VRHARSETRGRPPCGPREGIGKKRLDKVPQRLWKQRGGHVSSRYVADVGHLSEVLLHALRSCSHQVHVASFRFDPETSSETRPIHPATSITLLGRCRARRPHCSFARAADAPQARRSRVPRLRPGMSPGFHRSPCGLSAATMVRGQALSGPRLRPGTIPANDAKVVIVARNSRTAAGLQPRRAHSPRVGDAARPSPRRARCGKRRGWGTGQASLTTPSRGCT
jgi:hypothetical protein